MNEVLIQLGGSVNDEKMTVAANQHDLATAFTEVGRFTTTDR